MNSAIFNEIRTLIDRNHLGAVPARILEEEEFAEPRHHDRGCITRAYMALREQHDRLAPSTHDVLYAVHTAQAALAEIATRNENLDRASVRLENLRRMIMVEFC